MEGVLEDEDLSFEDALAYTDALFQAETAHKASQEHLPGSSNCNQLSQIQESNLVPVFEGGPSEAPLRHLTDTEAMKAGTKQHAILEAETAGITVEVLIETREDAFALRLLNMEAGLQQLLASGLTRELPIGGFLQESWVSGIIDQLELTEEGLIRISEQKTRFQPSLPSESQKKTTAVQVMIYRHLVNSLQDLYSPASYNKVCEKRGLDPDLSLANAIREHAGFSKKQRANLRHVFTRLQHTLACLPACDAVMHVNYIWQGDGLLLEREEVKFDSEVLDEAVRKHLGFWSGACPPAKVPPEETWKCRNCHFNGKCWPAHRKAVPWQH